MIVDLGSWPMDPPDPAPIGGTVVWLFGRGLSMECGLDWTEPEEWKTKFQRLERIERIKQALPAEMAGVDAAPIREFLIFLDQRTSPEWQHLFVTTNWDHLLQRELSAFVHGLGAPRWVHRGAGSYVYHVNGTVEEGTQHRSCFMLQDDTGAERTATTEANYAFSYLLCEQTFVVVGMSFGCKTDQFLLRQLNKVQDEMPIGDSHWIIVNRDREASEAVSAHIRSALPNAHVESAESTFADWRHAGCPSLTEKGVFSRTPTFVRCDQTASAR
jgi:hypothetical protein